MEKYTKPVVNVEFTSLPKNIISSNRSLSVKVTMKRKNNHVLYDLQIIGFGFKRVRRDQLLDIINKLHQRAVYEDSEEIFSVVEFDGSESDRLKAPIASLYPIITDIKCLNHPFDFHI